MAAPSSDNWTGNSKRRNLEEGEREASTRYWPEDVIREILVRLPIKSILRFKSTSKSWYALIRSRSFIDFHRTRRLDDDDHADELFFSQSHSNEHVYTPEDEEPYIISSLSYCSSSGLKTESTPLFDLKLLRQALAVGKVGLYLKKRLLVNVPGVYVLGPLSNGISCVIALEFFENTISGQEYCYSKIAFCNLSTREFNVLADPFPFPRRGVGVMFYFPHYYGFGSIQNHEGVVVDYKMVVVEHNVHNQSFRAAVYSQRRGSWKLISPKVVGEHEFPTKITQTLFHFPVQALLNGSCHWMAKKKQSNSNGSQQDCVLQFDLAKEVFGLIAAPPQDDYCHRPLEYRVDTQALVLDNRLAAVTVVMQFSPRQIHHIDVWMMMEYGAGASWTKIHSCKVHLQDHMLGRVFGMSFSRADDGGTNIDKFFFQDWMWNKNLISCDGSGYKKHSDFEYQWAIWKPLGLSPYVETLEPVSLQL